MAYINYRTYIKQQLKVEISYFFFFFLLYQINCPLKKIFRGNINLNLNLNTGIVSVRGLFSIGKKKSNKLNDFFNINHNNNISVMKTSEKN